MGRVFAANVGYARGPLYCLLGLVFVPVKPRDILLAVMVPVLWGLGFTFAKAGLDQFPPILMTALRFTLTAAVLVWLVRPPWGMMARIFWIALIAGTIQYSLTFTGLTGLDASTAIVVVQLEVPFAVLLSVLFLKDRLGWRRVLGMAFAFAGVMLIAGEPRLHTDTLPMLLVVAGSLAWAIGQVMIKTVSRAGGVTLIAWVAVFSAPQLWLATYLFEDGQAEAIAAADWMGWGVIVYLGLVMTAVGYATWYHLLGIYRVSQVMPFLMLLPVTAMTGGVLLLGETVTPVTVLGAAIVIGGVGVISLGRRRPRPAHPMTLDDARAVAAAYRASRRAGAFDIAAMEAAVMVYLKRYPEVAETDARIFVSDLIVQAGESR